MGFVLLSSFCLAQNDTNWIASELKFKEEKHLTNIKQLTFGGDNAEAYFSFNDSLVTFQVTNKNWKLECDQIFYFDWRSADLKNNLPKMISSNTGRTTCSYFMPGDTSIIYASTHGGQHGCPALPAKRSDRKYVWPIYADYDIYVSDLKGNIIKRMTDTPGYDAEATVSPKGDKIVFTSTRSGDLELWVMDIDGSNPKQITNQLGYDGGAFFSPDGSKLIFRASRPTTDEDKEVYNSLAKENLVMPTQMSLYICNADGSGLRKITDLANASWAPFFHPSGEKVIFASNYKSKRGLPFNLYLINTDGSGLEQITYDTMFDSFPMFSHNGKKLIFSSNRNNNGTSETNLFIADWVE